MLGGGIKKEIQLNEKCDDIWISHMLSETSFFSKVMDDAVIRIFSSVYKCEM